VEYFNCLDSTITNDARCTREINFRTVTAKAAFNKKKAFYQQQIEFKFKEETSKVLFGAETWTIQTVDQKYHESNEMWCWRRMEKISWTDRVRN
jgi:hypothetical protein